jgi:hypothetical protein
MAKNTKEQDRQALLIKLGLAADPAVEAAKNKAMAENADRIKSSLMGGNRPFMVSPQSSTYVAPKQKPEKSKLTHRPDGSVPIRNIESGVGTYMINPQAEVREGYSKSGPGLTGHIAMLDALPSAHYNRTQARRVLGDTMFDNIQAEKKSIANPESDYLIEVSHGSKVPESIGAGGFYSPFENTVYVPKDKNDRILLHESTHSRNFNSGLKTDYNFNGIPNSRALERGLNIVATAPSKIIERVPKALISAANSFSELQMPRPVFDDSYYLDPSEIAARISPLKQQAIEENLYNGLSTEKDIDLLANDVINGNIRRDNIHKVLNAMKRKYGEKDGTAKFRALFKVIVDNKEQTPQQLNSAIDNGIDIS